MLKGAPAGTPQELLLSWDCANSNRKIRALVNKNKQTTTKKDQTKPTNTVDYPMAQRLSKL